MFYLRLARDLGMTRAQLLAGISSRELTDWMAFYRIEAEQRAEADAQRK
jgi:hypothetical protein